jgi:hypothetical protein
LLLDLIVPKMDLVGYIFSSDQLKGNMYTYRDVYTDRDVYIDRETYLCRQVYV